MMFATSTQLDILMREKARRRLKNCNGKLRQCRLKHKGCTTRNPPCDHCGKALCPQHGCGCRVTG